VKRLFIFILCLQLAACSSSRLNLNVPQLPFVTTLIANLSPEDGKVRYVMRYELDKDAPVNLYAKIHYQDIANKNIYHTTIIDSLGQTKVLNFNSVPGAEIINQQHFEITLLLYKDANYSNIIGIHRDLVWFEMPATVAEVLHITLR